MCLGEIHLEAEDWASAEPDILVAQSSNSVPEM